MQRIYIFLAEIPTALLAVELSPSTKNELFNIGVIIAVRLAFYAFERKFPKLKEKLSKKEQNG